MYDGDKRPGEPDGFGDEALHDGFAEHEAESASPQPALALDDDERLPWLESADEDDADGAADSGRLARLAIFALVLVIAVGAGIWFVNHRPHGGEMVADGGVIKAPARPYKEAPKNQGGKTFAGTGDSAFAVSEGKSTQAKLGDNTPAPSIAVGANAEPVAAAAGVGVQVGAYSSPAAAEAGWTRLAGSHDALGGLKHRVLEGSADIGTVYRLQAVAADDAAANALCSALKTAGLACQVKR